MGGMNRSKNWIPASKLLYPPTHRDVTLALKGVTDGFPVYPGSRPRSELRERLFSVVNNLMSWLKPHLDLGEFDSVYPTSGISQGLQVWLLHEKRKVFRLRGDYRYLDEVSEDIIVVDSVDDVPDSADGIFYLSSPSSRDGNLFKDWDRLKDKKFSLALDLAFHGTAPMAKVPITSNVEFVFYSFSKPFGVPSLRAGWMFARKPMPSLEAMLEVGYLPYLHLTTTERIINKFSPDFCYQWLHPFRDSVCSQADLVSADSVFVGLSESLVYEKFRREGLELARIPIMQFMERQL